MVPDRQKRKVFSKEWWSTTGVDELGDMYKYNPRPRRKERMEEGKERRRTTLLPPHRVRTGHGRRKRVRTGLEARAACYKRAGGAWMEAGSVLRRRSDRNAKPVFLMPRRAKRFRALPEGPLQQGPSPRWLRPGTEAASQARRQGRRFGERKRCVRLHDSKTRCRGGRCSGGSW